MATEQIWTPYNDKIKELEAVIYRNTLQSVCLLELHEQAKGYRRSVADYAELVKASEEVVSQLHRLNERQGIDIDYSMLEAALAKVKGGE